MFIVSAGLPKSGSAWFYQITDQLLQKTGHTPARALKVRYGLQPLLKRHNCVIPVLSPPVLRALNAVAKREGAFVVKTHSPPPTVFAAMSNQPSGPKSTLIYRDPRDVAISALEHGQRQRSRGEHHLPFARIQTLDQALLTCREWLRTIYLPWSHMPGSFRVTYEDLLNDTHNVTRSLADYLGIAASDEIISEVITPLEAKSVERGSAEASRLHLNKAQAFRYKTLMTEAEQALARKVLGSWIDLMGYDPKIEASSKAIGVDMHIRQMREEAEESLFTYAKCA